MNELVAIIIIILAALFAIFIFIKIFSEAAKVGKKGVNKSVQLIDSINSNLKKKQEEQFKRKLRGVVGEEVVRELTRQAIRKGIEPSLYNVCAYCSGQGCSNCNHQGWLPKD